VGGDHPRPGRGGARHRLCGQLGRVPSARLAELAYLTASGWTHTLRLSTKGSWGCTSGRSLSLQRHCWPPRLRQPPVAAMILCLTLSMKIAPACQVTEISVPGARRVVARSRCRSPGKIAGKDGRDGRTSEERRTKVPLVQLGALQWGVFWTKTEGTSIF
jgi:hypothetical protein